jgi:hypothetical protein
MTTPAVSPETLASVKVTSYFKERVTGQFSGFFYRHNGNVYLISNWHALSGRNCFTGQCLDKNTLMPPDSVTFSCYLKKGNGVSKKTVTKRINNTGVDDLSGWIQHRNGQQIDVAAIDIGTSDGSIICANGGDGEAYIGSTLMRGINDYALLKPAVDIFVVGFPLGLSSHESLAIWKRGTIASEAEVERRFDYFFIDCTSNYGLSGSPAYIHSSGAVLLNNGNTAFGGYTEFVGIYSGRMLGDFVHPAEGQPVGDILTIGRVFYKRVIMEMLDHPSYPSYQIETKNPR